MLTINEAGQFVLLARTPELAQRAEAAALTQSIPTSLQRGHPVFFTDCAYQVLEFWPCAVPKARERLLDLMAMFQRSMAKEVNNQYPTPAGLELMPFQRAGIHYALDQHGVLIGDEMGLGKTVQAIVLANEMQVDRVLAVVPGGTRKQWATMVRAWSTISRPHIYPIYKGRDGVHARSNWTIISYNLLSNRLLFERLMNELRPQLLILDEAHFLKEVTSKRSRAVWGYHDERENAAGLAEGAEKVLALTGTPLPNRPAEGYTLARGLNWAAIDFMSKDAYRMSFNPSVRITRLESDGTWKHKTLEKAGRLRELQSRLRCNLMVRRLEKNVQTQLPQERYHITFLEPDGAIRKQLKAEEPLLLKIKDFEDLEGLQIDEKAHIATLRRLMGIAKAPRIVEHVQTIMSSTEKLLVFAYHREVLSILREQLESYNPVLYWGGMSAAAQEKAKLRFMRDPRCHIWLGQVVASGIGLDGLQEVCSHVLFAEFDWVPGNNAQAVKRLKRIGQQKSVLAEFAIAPGGLCERILGSSLDKLATTTTALD